MQWSEMDNPLTRNRVMNDREQKYNLQKSLFAVTDFLKRIQIFLFLPCINVTMG